MYASDTVAVAAVGAVGADAKIGSAVCCVAFAAETVPTSDGPLPPTNGKTIVSTAVIAAIRKAERFTVVPPKTVCHECSPTTRIDNRRSDKKR